MKRTLIITILALIFAFSQSMAQQDPLYGLYLNNPLLINPAYSGLHDQASANFSYRSQWAGMDGSPGSAVFNVHGSLNQNKIGAGLMIINDRIGITNTLEIAATYSYKINFDNGTLSLGLQAGFFNARTDHTSLRVKDQDAIFEQDVNYSKPNFGAGVMYSNERFVAGISMPRMFNHSVDADNGTVNIYNRHMYMMTGAFVNLSAKSIFRPFLYLRYVNGAPVSYDIRTDFIINDLLMAGTYTRNFNQFGFTFGVFPQRKYRLIYQYELPVNTMESTFSSHELTLGIDFAAFKFHNPKFKYF